MVRVRNNICKSVRRHPTQREPTEVSHRKPPAAARDAGRVPLKSPHSREEAKRREPFSVGLNLDPGRPLDLS